MTAKKNIKVIPPGSTELTITLPNEIVGFIRSQAAILNIPVGRVIRRAVETYAANLDRVEEVESEKRELASMMQEIRASMRVIANFTAATVRDEEAIADDISFEA